MSTTSKPKNDQTDTSSDADAIEAIYDRFVERVHDLSEASQEKSREAMERAMEAARQQMSVAGEFTAEQGEAFKGFMRKDLEQTQKDMKAIGKEAREHLHPARLGAGAMSSIARVLEASGGALQYLARKAEDALSFHTGDITMAGTLTCAECGQELHLHKTSMIPPCPSCHSTNFRKGY